MSIWDRISDALAALANGEGLSAVFDKLRGPPETSVAFTIAVVALGAKMAKADGQVSRHEVAAFRQVFEIAQEDEEQAARVFNLARQDVAGFDAYARKIAAMFDDNHTVLNDLMEGLFHIATADDTYHDAENEFLQEVARIFRLTDQEFRLLRARFVTHSDPYAVLDATPDTPLKNIKKNWQMMVRNTHPDALSARGLPPEAIAMAAKRLIAINAAWDAIQKQHSA